MKGIRLSGFRVTHAHTNTETHAHTHTHKHTHTHTHTHPRTHTHTHTHTLGWHYHSRFLGKILMSMLVYLGNLKTDEAMQCKLTRLARFFGLAWLPCCKQVRWDDQSQYPKVTIESFVGQSSMGLLCPPAADEFTLSSLQKPLA